MRNYFWREEKGQGLLEMAIVLPILILLFFGMIEMARVGYAYITVNNAARAGARIATVGGLDYEITQAIYKAAPNLNTSKLTLEINPTQQHRSSGEEIRIEIKYPVELITPIVEGVIPNPIVVGSSLSMRME